MSSPLNPYQSPTISTASPDVAATDSRWQGFKRGFRNGAFWSMLLVIPTTPALHAEMTTHRRFLRDPATGTTTITDLSTTDSLAAWGASVGTALTAISLPWALVAGCVGQATVGQRHRRPASE